MKNTFEITLKLTVETEQNAYVDQNSLKNLVNLMLKRAGINALDLECVGVLETDRIPDSVTWEVSQIVEDDKVQNLEQFGTSAVPLEKFTFTN